MAAKKSAKKSSRKPRKSKQTPLPTSCDVGVSVAAGVPKKAAVVVAARPQEGRAVLCGDVDRLPEELRDAAETLLDGDVNGKAGETATRTTGGTRVVVIGVGEAGDARRFGVAAARQAKRHKLANVALLPPGDDLAGDAASGFVMGLFDYREHRGAASAKREAESLGRVELTVVGDDSIRDAVTRGESVGLGQNYARTIASRPGNDIDPPSLAAEAEQLAGRLGSLSCRVIDEKELEKLGMGGILAVGKGSDSPPRLICLEHKPRKSKKGTPPLLVVGKAITFDTGGLSLKSPASMPSMIFDKCGGMAVLGFMAAVAMTNLDRPVVGLLAAAENMPGPTAYRPGDILRMYNGVTVDVTNTDAEGRLVLADAIAWGVETYRPAACVDLATLTGACVVALGNERAGAWSNDDDLFAALDSAAGRAGEKLWRMPLGDDYRDLLRAPSADVLNSPGRYGGACTAAEFLHHFVPGNVEGTKEVPWCHLDIAGPASTDKDTPHYAKGATGFGVRTLLEWAESA